MHQTNTESKTSVLPISGHTRMLCLLGSPVAHSLSPAMHNFSFEALRIDARYLAFDITEKDLAATLQTFRSIGVKGLNLTMPLKTAAVALCDRLSLAASIADSVNTIVFEDDGSITGHTTDGIGFTESIRQEGVDFKGKKVTLLGTGGAGIAILVQLALDGASEISVFERAESRFHNRTANVVSRLNHETACHVSVFEYDDAVLQHEIRHSALLVNATNVGMAPNTERSLIKDASWFSGLAQSLTVSDVIYNPRETMLMKQAASQGLHTVNGMYMLLYQGAAAFRLWTGRDMPVDAVKKAFFTEPVEKP